MLLHVQKLFTRLAVSKTVVSARGFGTSAAVSKTAAAAATAGRNKSVARKPAEKAAKPKNKAQAKPKAKKPKAAKLKTPTKKATLEALISAPSTHMGTAYTVFSKEKFNEIARTQGSGSPKEILTSVSRSVSQMWRDLDASTKKQYAAKLAKHREQRMAELRRWWSTADRALIDLENKRRRRINAQAGGAKLALLHDPFAPKRPPTSYGLFVIERVKGQAGANVREVSPVLSAEWKAMSEAQKAPYVREAAERNEQYKKDLGRYKSGLTTS
ncbi:hypothetical protein IW150_003149 [Coemansia sp. RSA 2607]|nr:hypothetical protein IW150_003149 [Coemansia sp. RSA 2607]